MLKKLKRTSAKFIDPLSFLRAAKVHKVSVFSYILYLEIYNMKTIHLNIPRTILLALDRLHRELFDISLTLNT